LHKEEDLELEEEDLEIFRKQRVNGRDFLKMTKQDFREYDMKGGPASRLADFAKECKEKKLRSFSSYKTKKELKEVLRKYGIDSNEITKIPPFEPEPVEIDDEDEELEQCITEIKRRMGIIGSATDRSEAVRCEYISPILYASIYIAKRITNKGITMDPQFEVIGEEASGRVDYAIKKIIDVVNEELIAITEGKQKDLGAGFMQNIMQLESSHHTNTRKRKASVAFDDEFDYLYGIVSTGRAWPSQRGSPNQALWHVFYRSYILTRVFLCLASDWYFLMYCTRRKGFIARKTTIT